MITYSIMMCGVSIAICLAFLYKTGIRLEITRLNIDAKDAGRLYILQAYTSISTAIATGALLRLRDRLRRYIRLACLVIAVSTITLNIIVMITSGSKSAIISGMFFVYSCLLGQKLRILPIKVNSKKLFTKMQLSKGVLVLIICSTALVFLSTNLLSQLISMMLDLSNEYASSIARARYWNQFDQLNAILTDDKATDSTFYINILHSWLQPFLQRIGIYYKYFSLSHEFGGGDSSAVASNLVWEVLMIHSPLVSLMVVCAAVVIINQASNNIFYSFLRSNNNNNTLTIYRILSGPLIFGSYGLLLWGGSFIQSILVNFSITIFLYLTVKIINIRC